jgi:hypothetical protein
MPNEKATILKPCPPLARRRFIRCRRDMKKGF